MHKISIFKICLSLFAFLLINTALTGQSNCNSFTVEEKVLPGCEKPLPPLVLQYNAIANHFGLEDTISYVVIQHNNVLDFKQKWVADLKTKTLPNRGEELILDTYYQKITITRHIYGMVNQTNGISTPSLSFQAVIETKDQPTEVWNYANDIFTQYESIQGRKEGRYEEKYCNGNLRLTGQYCLVDTLLIDTMVVFNPETYEEEVVTTKSYAHSRKAGTWTHYDINGKLEEKETFSPCK